jgi:uncharacterized protein YjbJ (UPF0337 family)
MKPSTTDQIEGTIHQAKGAAKEKIGQIANDPDLKAEGHAEHRAGQVQKKVADLEKVLNR